MGKSLPIFDLKFETCNSLFALRFIPRSKLIIKDMIASLSSGVKFNILLGPGRIWGKSVLEQGRTGDFLKVIKIGKIF